MCYAKIYRIVCIVVSICLSISIFSSCSSQLEADRVDDETLVRLRSEYEYNNTQPQTVSMMSYESSHPSLDAVFGTNEYEWYNDYSAIVVLEFEGNWYDANTNVAMFDNEDLNATLENKVPGIGAFSWMVHNAVIKEILWSNASLNVGDSIVVGFGSTIMTAGVGYEKIFSSGNQYVCFLFDESNLSFKIDNLYSTAKPYSFYLTNKNVLLSVTSAPGPDSVSGMYLDAFTTLVNETLGPPDAELTPVEPELQTE